MGEGLRTIPRGGVAAPPYTNGPYTQDQDMTYAGNLRKSPGRYYLEEFFPKRPGLNASIAAAFTDADATAAANTTITVAREVANKDFEILGTNATADDVTFSATSAGMLLTTDGGDNDQIIILPHLDTNQTAWASVLWGTENQVIWESVITTGDDIATGLLLWAGLKLTNDPTVATDDDQVFFRFSTDDSDTNWEIVSSIADTDTTTDSGVAVAASTQYKFRIEIDSSRKAHFYINDIEIYVTAALTNDVDLIPYVGIQALSGTGEFVTLHYEKISRILFE